MKNNIMRNKNTNNIIEGYTNATVDSIQTKNTQVIKIKNYPFHNLIPEFGINKSKQKQLNQFCIKSSCNSAYDGTDVSLDMIQYVLSRGCRFLDFEIYWGKPKLPDGTEDKGQTTPVPVVSVSNDPSTPEKNCISLDSVFKFIAQYGFNNNVCPNSKDPLFIQMRIKYIVPTDIAKPNNQKSLYEGVLSTILNRLQQFLYKDKVTGTTDITSLAGKIVLIMDTYANRDYKGIIGGLSHMESNSDVLTHTTYEDVIKERGNSFPIDGDGVVTNMKIMQQVLPMSTINSVQYLFTDNYDSMSVISRYSAQFTPMIFWANDSYLQAYEKMFNSVGTGIMMLPSAMNYSDGQKVVASVVYP